VNKLPIYCRFRWVLGITLPFDKHFDKHFDKNRKLMKLEKPTFFKKWA